MSKRVGFVGSLAVAVALSAAAKVSRADAHLTTRNLAQSSQPQNTLSGTYMRYYSRPLGTSSVVSVPMYTRNNTGFFGSVDASRIWRGSRTGLTAGEQVKSAIDVTKLPAGASKLPR